ncbi:MAG: hypothetical protein PHI45_02965 [Candidatus Pacebacteria bacterium]|jgi:hypothetical protein|nr:hypothetical protein [Candidatus Paceibacterota bacterium]MDD5753015.1 hypothetical protein [Candidatus Paceibacterota bacterium]
MKKQDFLNLILMIILGIFGGLLALYFFFINNFFASPTIINQQQEKIYIEENTALINSIKETKKAVFTIKQGTLSFYGLILTADGLAVTLSSNLNKNPITCNINGENASCQILKRDLVQNLALIKIEKDKLSTLGFYDLDLEMGKRVYVLSIDSVNEGIVKSVEGNTNIRETQPISGSPVLSLDNKIIGLAEIDKNGFISIIPVSIIRSFVGL